MSKLQLSNAGSRISSLIFSLAFAVSQIAFNVNAFADDDVASLVQIHESVEPLCGPKIGRSETICPNVRYCIRERPFGGISAYRPGETEQCRGDHSEITVQNSAEAERIALGGALNLLNSGLLPCGPGCEIAGSRPEAIPVTCGAGQPTGYYGFATRFCRKILPPDDIAAVPSDMSSIA